jgi:Tol biopolymer transport system component
MMTGDHEIWISGPDGSDQRQLTNDPADDVAPIVSTDNRYIFFESNRTGKIQIWRMDIDGANQTQITMEEGGFPIRITPDGQWLYYRSGLHNTLRRVSLQDRKEELIYDSASADFALSPDCSRIILTRGDDESYTFSIVSLADRKTEMTFQTPDPSRRPVYVIWSPDGKTMALVLEDESHENRSLWFQDISGAKPRKIADLRPGEISELSGMAISSDAKSFAVVQGTWNHDAVRIKGLKQ